MTTKYSRPAGAYAGQTELANGTKYQDDSTATPRRPISSSKVDGDFNYVIEALNSIDAASGSRASIAERIGMSLNDDGTLKVGATASLDEFTTLTGPTSLQRVDNSTVRLVGGDYRSLFSANRRVRLVISGQPYTGDVATTSLSSGNTLVELVDVVDATGALAVIATAPTSIAYGPLTTGVNGNAPRAVDAFKIAGFTFADASGDLGITAPGGGSPAAKVTASGVSGFASQSVGVAALASAVTALLVPTGMVAPYAGATAPTGWLMCYGQAISRATYSSLFTAIGTTYGTGDGSTTFNLPDLRGRAVFGLDNMGGSAASRLTSGNSGITSTALGSAGGDERLYQHTHTLTDSGHRHTTALVTSNPDSNATYGIDTSATHAGKTASGNGTIYNTYTSTTATGITVNNAGSGNSQNVPPAMVLNYIIKV